MTWLVSFRTWRPWSWFTIPTLVEAESSSDTEEEEPNGVDGNVEEPLVSRDQPEEPLVVDGTTLSECNDAQYEALRKVVGLSRLVSQTPFQNEVRQLLHDIEEAEGKDNRVKLVFELYEYLLSDPEAFQAQSKGGMVKTSLTKLDEFEEQYPSPRWNEFRQRILALP